MAKRTLHPKKLGEAAEVCFMARAALLGLTVSKPLGDSALYDLITDSCGLLRRVQVKSASVRDRRRYAIMTSSGGCKRAYTPGQIDLLAAYVFPEDAWYIIPVAALAARTRIHLYPHLAHTPAAPGLFERFRDRWDLLLDGNMASGCRSLPLSDMLPREHSMKSVSKAAFPLPSAPSSVSSGFTSADARGPMQGRPANQQRPTQNGKRSAAYALSVLNAEVVACRRCPRLVAYREQIGREKRRAYRDCEYWARPVPGFGDPQARVLVLGLAPGAHGSNRTGRMFTGDSSGNFMYPVLHATGFANQPGAGHRDDGLRLKGCYITAAVRCAPPANKPLPAEIAACSTFLDRELALLGKVRVVVALGRIGFDAYLNHLKRRGLLPSKAPYVFAHGAQYEMPDGRILLASYHPSNQNTQTGKLTRRMFTEIFRTAARLVKAR